MTCTMYRGAYIRHNPEDGCCPKGGKRAPFIPSEVLKYFIRGLLIELRSFQGRLIMPRKKEQKVSYAAGFRQLLGIIKDAG